MSRLCSQPPLDSTGQHTLKLETLIEFVFKWYYCNTICTQFLSLLSFSSSLGSITIIIIVIIAHYLLLEEKAGQVEKVGKGWRCLSWWDVDGDDGLINRWQEEVSYGRTEWFGEARSLSVNLTSHQSCWLGEVRPIGRKDCGVRGV